MIYQDFKGEKLSQLGFGTMRLPVKADGSIDEDEVFEMTDYALANGVNYFDTAYPYCGGRSEIVIGRALARHPRDKFLLATKYPGHQIAETYNPAEIFEEQLKKCGVEYFDYYLLHNVYENSIPIYEDPKLGVIEYFLEQKRLGRIRHLGFSCHARLGPMAKFLDFCGDRIEFCQIQLNYIDWTLQNAREKYEMLRERDIPIWVMEPVRGGKLANLPEKESAKLRALRPNESDAAWSLRWLQDMPGIAVILSGMSNMAQMRDNVATFSSPKPLDASERALLLEIADNIKDALPCTACRYCCDGCPQGLDIPALIQSYNDVKFHGTMNSGMYLEGLPEDKRPSACIACGACERVCPQKIAIPKAMAELAKMYEALPKWSEICRQRAAAAAALRGNERLN